MGLLIIPIANESDDYKAGKYGRRFVTSNWSNKDAVNNVLRDITRTRTKEKETEYIKLYGYGGCGVDYRMPIEYVISLFDYVQRAYDIDSRNGRRIYHEVMWLSDEDLESLGYSIEKMWDFAWWCANEFYYKKGHQVLFAIHGDFCEEGKTRYHIHFAVNAVNYINGHKYESFMGDQKIRNEIANQKILEYKSKYNMPVKAVHFAGDIYYK